MRTELNRYLIIFLISFLVSLALMAERPVVAYSPGPPPLPIARTVSRHTNSVSTNTEFFKPTNAVVWIRTAKFLTNGEVTGVRFTANNSVVISNCLCLTLRGSNNFPVLNPTSGWYPILTNVIFKTNITRKTIRFTPDWSPTNKFALLLDDSNTFTYTNIQCLSLNGSDFPMIPDSVFEKVRRHPLFTNSFTHKTVTFYNPDRKP